MSKPVSIHIPKWHPTSVNKLLRMHWAKRNRLVKSEYQTVAAYAGVRRCGSGLPGLHPKGICGCVRRRVAVTFVLRPKQRACDPDAQLKGLLDGLKRCGAIVDDSRTWIELEPVEYTRGTEESWGTTIVLEDLPAVEQRKSRQLAAGE